MQCENMRIMKKTLRLLPVVLNLIVCHWGQNTIKFIINKVDERKEKKHKNFDVDLEWMWYEDIIVVSFFHKKETFTWTGPENSRLCTHHSTL